MNTKQFFYRNMVYTKTGQDIYLIDIENPDAKGEKLEPWFGVIYQLADGQHSIEELQQLLSRKYQGAPPQNLLQTITSIVERLSSSKLIVLTDEKTDLPYYLSMPYDLMNKDMAKDLYEQDRLNFK